MWKRLESKSNFSLRISLKLLPIWKFQPHYPGHVGGVRFRRTGFVCLPSNYQYQSSLHSLLMIVEMFPLVCRGCCFPRTFQSVTLTEAFVVGRNACRRHGTFIYSAHFPSLLAIPYLLLPLQGVIWPLVVPQFILSWSSFIVCLPCTVWIWYLLSPNN